MVAAINFFVDTDQTFSVDLAGSGLGFYGADFGTSVAVGSYQTKTYVTSSDGGQEGPIARNVTFTHASSGTTSNLGNLNLVNIPNYQATLNIRFTNDSAVQVQNAELRIYDRSDITVGAEGVLTKVAEIIHIDPNQGGSAGSGDTAWIEPVGDTLAVSLDDSPGESGYYANNNSTHSSTRHDWYAAISASPSSIGSKVNFGLFCQLEYI